MQISLPNLWRPRPYQQKAWNYLRAGGKRAALCWARRHGKDDLSLHYTAVAAHQIVGSYWHMLPKQNQGQKAIWRQVNKHTGKKRIDEAFPPSLRRRTLDDEMFIEFQNGSTWQVVGSDNYDSLVGASTAGIVFSEYARSDPSAWAYMRPILRENKGWAIFISTAFGKNHFYHMIQLALREMDWFGEIVTCDDSHLLTQEELAAELRELQAEHGDTYGKSIWLQEYYCSFDAAIPGAIWAESLDRLQLNGKIMDFDHDRTASVFTGWDLGRTDDTAIWFYQFRGTEIDVIDYWADHGCEIYDSEAKEKSISHVLLDKAQQYGYTYATHWVPHDARPRRLGMGGKSILQQFHDAAKLHPSLGTFQIAPKLDVQEGIQAARKTFQDCRFHATRCDLGLQALRHYHREWDPEKKIYTDVPVHDFSSHCCLVEGTLVKTRRGDVPIEQVERGESVWTPSGYAEVIHAGPVKVSDGLIEIETTGGVLTCTPEHKILTRRGFLEASDLQRDDTILTGKEFSCVLSSLISTVLGIGFRATITGETFGIPTDRLTFIERCGRSIMVQYRKVMTSIMSMGTPSITTSQIWPSWSGASTDGGIPWRGLPAGTSFLQASTHCSEPPSGIGLQMGYSGIPNMGSAPGNTERPRSVSAATAGNSLSPSRRQGQDGVASDVSWTHAPKRMAESLAPSESRFGACVRSAASRFCRWLLRLPCTAIRIVKLKHIDGDEGRQWVYDLTVKKHACYQANGLLVSNSDAFRTMAVTWKASKIQVPEPISVPIITRMPTFGEAKKYHFERKKALREGYL